MKKVILVWGILFFISCSKTETPISIKPIEQEESIKFTTSADTISSSNNIIDEFPLSINLTSALPKDGVKYSIQVIKNENAQIVFKLDTLLTQNSLSVKITGINLPDKYNLVINLTSKSLPTNTQTKSIILNRFYVKKYIYVDAWKNQPDIPMWFKPSGSERQVWCDLDLDGNYDAIDLIASGNSVYFKGHYYGEKYIYKKTIDIASLVRNDALNKFFQDTISNLKDITNANIGITDFNHDSIPDIIFGIETQEEPNSTRYINSWQLVLLSKNVQDYELKIIPIFFRGGANDLYLDLNADGICDYLSPEHLINRLIHPQWQQSKFIECYFDNNFKVSYQGKEQSSWGIVSHATDYDNNGITDFVLSGEDFPFSGGIIASPGEGPSVYLNYSNQGLKKTSLLYNKTFSDSFQSIYLFDFSVGNINGDLDGDGNMDQVFLKSCFEGSPIISDSLKKTGIFQIFIGNGKGDFIDKTDTWFDNKTNKVYLLEFANPKELLLGDVDNDGKRDIYFKYIQNIYFKNTGSKLVLTKSSGNNFGFPSQNMKSFSNQ